MGPEPEPLKKKTRKNRPFSFPCFQKELEVGKGGGEDVYEKTVPRHGDEYMHKFITTIQKNPGKHTGVYNI